MFSVANHGVVSRSRPALLFAVVIVAAGMILPGQKVLASDYCQEHGCSTCVRLDEGTLWPQTRIKVSEKMLAQEKEDFELEAGSSRNNSEELSDLMRYKQAVQDSLVIDPAELLPLVSLSPGEPFVTYSKDGTRILMLTVHSYPQTYPTGARKKLPYQCWTFTDKEFLAWYEAVGQYNQKPWQLRINQLLGMPAEHKSTHVTAMWVLPEDIVRPAYNSDIYSSCALDSFAEALKLNFHTYGINQYQVVHGDEDQDGKVETTAQTAGRVQVFRQWFNDNIISSYFSGDDYPWTRIGYTYDWGRADGKTAASEYGLSEFLVKEASAVTIAYTVTLDDFIAKVRKQLASEKVLKAAAAAGAAAAAAAQDDPATAEVEKQATAEAESD